MNNITANDLILVANNSVENDDNDDSDDDNDKFQNVNNKKRNKKNRIITHVSAEDVVNRANSIDFENIGDGIVGKFFEK